MDESGSSVVVVLAMIASVVVVVIATNGIVGAGVGLRVGSRVDGAEVGLWVGSRVDGAAVASAAEPIAQIESRPASMPSSRPSGLY